jgi:hypothetical protein
VGTREERAIADAKVALGGATIAVSCGCWFAESGKAVLAGQPVMTLEAGYEG